MKENTTCPHCPKERPMSKEYKKERNKTCGSKECMGKQISVRMQGASKTSNWNRPS